MWISCLPSLDSVALDVQAMYLCSSWLLRLVNFCRGECSSSLLVIGGLGYRKLSGLGWKVMCPNPFR